GFEAVAARHQIVGIAAVLAVLTIGERATLATTLAMGQEQRLGAAGRITRAIAAHTFTAKDTIAAADAATTFDAAIVAARIAIFSDEARILGQKLFSAHVHSFHVFH